MKRCTILFMLLISITASAQNVSEQILGEYQIRPGFNVIVSSEDSGLMIKATGQPIERLIEQNSKKYEIKSIKGTIDFSLLSERNVAVIQMFGQTVHAPKLPLSHQKIEKNEIEIIINSDMGFEGNYDLGNKSIMSITLEENELYLQVTGQPKFPVFPFAEDKFFLKVVDAWIEFVKDSNGKIDYLLMHQGGAIIQADKM